jgi:hypothetical protein
MDERERIRPTAEGRARLLAAVEAGVAPCAVDPGRLGEYAALLADRGQIAADAAFPNVAGHLREGCATCPDDLRAMAALLEAPDDPSPVEDRPGPPTAPPRVEDPSLTPAALRDALLRMGVTQMSAGSHTEPGGYNAPDAATGQFEVADLRSPAEVAATLRSLGYEPVWEEWSTVTPATEAMLAGR